MKYLVDANILVALFKRDDNTHHRAVKLVNKFKTERNQFLALNLVIQESATVISFKMGQANARRFYQGINAIIDHILPLDETLEERSWEIFLEQTKKGTSFIDCANIAAIEQYKLDRILSFDAFYPKTLTLPS